MTPEQEEQVRQALAATARAEPTPPIPPDLGARLDDVLADLVADRAGREAARTESGAGSPGPDQIAARRRRRLPNVLVAAAAVAVIAAAAGAVVTGGFGAGSGGAGSGTTSASRAETGAAGVAPQSGASAPAGLVPSPTIGRSPALAALPVARLRSASLRADVQRVADATARAATGDRQLTGSVQRASCATPAPAPGADQVAVRLDGRPATLVLAAPSGGTREARVYSCADGSTPVATTTVQQR